MGLFDLFTGDPAKDAARDQRQLFDATRGQFASAINSGLSNSTNNIQTGFGGGRDALRTAYGDSAAATDRGYGDTLDFLGGGRSDALGRYDAAGAAFTPLSELSRKYGGATSLALDALGTGGADGTQRARDAFTAGPAYGFNLDQGLEAINRARNARGMANSGNTDRDAQEYGAGLASREYNTWLSNLLGFTNPELSAASGAATGQAAANTNAGNLEAQYGRNMADAATGRAGMLADLAQRYGTGTAGSLQGEGTALAGLNTGAAQDWVKANASLVSPYAKTYSDEAQATMDGQKNAWNLGLKGLELGASALGGMGGLGNLASQYFGNGTGYQKNPWSTGGMFG